MEKRSRKANRLLHQQSRSNRFNTGDPDHDGHVLDARDSLHVASLPTGYELSSYVTDVHYQDGVAFAAGYPTTSISTDGGLTWKAYHSEEIMTTRLISSIGPNVYVMNVDGFLYRVRRTDLLSKIRSAP